MARPKIDPERLRGKRLELRLTLKQYMAWQAKARRSGQSLSAWLRGLADRDARM